MAAYWVEVLDSVHRRYIVAGVSNEGEARLAVEEADALPAEENGSIEIENGIEITYQGADSSSWEVLDTGVVE